MSNYNSTTDGGSWIPAGKPKSVPCQVRIRDTAEPKKGQHKRSIVVAVKAKTLGDLRNGAIQALQPAWGKKGYTLKPENIRIFYLPGGSKGEVHLITEDDGQQMQLLVGDPILSPKKNTGEEKKEDGNNRAAAHKFVAVEYFTILPETVVRTVDNSHACHVTFTHPDVPQQWTSVAPLYCAAFKKDECGHPWYSVNSNWEIKASGVSLRALDGSLQKVADDFDPFGSLGDEEETGERVMTLEQYDALTKNERDDIYGILKTSVSHDIPGVGGVKRPSVKSSIISINDEKKKKKRKDQSLATKRNTLIRFKLQKGTDLSKYNVAIVYDNSSKNHVTLVPTGVGGFGGFDREWFFHPHLRVFLPLDAFDKIQRLKEGSDERKEYLKNEVLGPFGDEPENFSWMYPGGGYTVLPKVAALFALHDLKIEASAEPLPLESGPRTDKQHQTYQAALVLHRLNLGWPVVLAIEQLENVKYVIGDLDQYERETLLDALEKVPSGVDYEDYETVAKSMDVDENYCDDVLSKMKDDLTRSPESKDLSKRTDKVDDEVSAVEISGLSLGPMTPLKTPLKTPYQYEGPHPYGTPADSKQGETLPPKKETSPSAESQGSDKTEATLASSSVTSVGSNQDQDVAAASLYEHANLLGKKSSSSDSEEGLLPAQMD